MKGKVAQSTRSGFTINKISIRTNIKTVITFSQLISSTPIFSCSFRLCFFELGKL